MPATQECTHSIAAFILQSFVAPKRGNHHDNYTVIPNPMAGMARTQLLLHAYNS